MSLPQSFEKNLAGWSKFTKSDGFIVMAWDKYMSREFLYARTVSSFQKNLWLELTNDII